MLFICTSSFTLPICFLFFFFKTTATTEIYTLSLHDALPISGHELAQRVRAERPDLKLIYSSGYSHEVLGQDVILREGINFLQKPYAPRKLLQTVRDCLERSND